MKLPLGKVFILTILAVLFEESISLFCDKFDLFLPDYSPWVLHLLLTILSVWAVTRLEGTNLRALGWGKPWLLIVGLAVGCSSVLLILGLAWVIGAIRPHTDSLSSHGWYWYLVFVFTVVAFVEELSYRGLVLRILRQGIGVTFATIIASGIFACSHLLNPYSHPGIIGLINLFLAGCLSAVLYIGSGSLWMPIAEHFAWNFTQEIALRGFIYTGSPWARKAFFGLEEWPITSVFLLILLSAAIWWCFKRMSIRKLNPTSLSG